MPLRTGAAVPATTAEIQVPSSGTWGPVGHTHIPTTPAATLPPLTTAVHAACELQAPLLRRASLCHHPSFRISVYPPFPISMCLLLPVVTYQPFSMPILFSSPSLQAWGTSTWDHHSTLCSTLRGQGTAKPQRTCLIPKLTKQGAGFTMGLSDLFRFLSVSVVACQRHPQGGSHHLPSTGAEKRTCSRVLWT